MTTAEATDKILKLLALAEGGSEHEAANAAAKVQVWLAKYRLTLADLKARELVEICVPSAGGWSNVLLAEVAHACGCRLLFVEHVQPPLAILIGASLDASMAAKTYRTVRQVIADRAVVAWADHVAALTDPVLGLHPALKEDDAEQEFTDSYTLGAISVVREHLAGKGPTVPVPDLPGGALVLMASREEALARAERYLTGKYGHRVRQGRPTSMTLSLHSMLEGSKVKL